jgi:hypothetical protein
MGTDLRWWLTRIVGGTAVVAGSFFATLALMDAYDTRNAVDLLQVVRRGAEVEIKLDPGACRDLPVGELSCDAPYVGHYDPAKNGWIITGRTKLSAAVLTNTFANAPNQPGNISIWGVLGTFDGTGRLFIQGKAAGTIRQSPKSGG